MNGKTKRFEPNELVWYYDEDNMIYQATVIATCDYSSGADWYYVILAGGNSTEPFTTQSHRVFRKIHEADCDRLEGLSRAATVAISKFIAFAQKTNAFSDNNDAKET